MSQAHWTDGPLHRRRYHRLQEHSWRRGGREEEEENTDERQLKTPTATNRGTDVSGWLGLGRNATAQSAVQSSTSPSRDSPLPSIAALCCACPLSVVCAFVRSLPPSLPPLCGARLLRPLPADGLQRRDSLATGGHRLPWTRLGGRLRVRLLHKAALAARSQADSASAVCRTADRVRPRG
jgi:hypothetical protein